MHCENYVDKQWSKTMERRKQDLSSFDKKRKSIESEQYLSVLITGDTSLTLPGEDTADVSFTAAEEEMESIMAARKRRRVAQEFRYVLSSIRKV